jgi:hypothetical protein
MKEEKDMDFEQFIPFRAGEILLHTEHDQLLLEDIFTVEEVNGPEGKEHCKITDWDHVTLHFDMDHNAIGIKPVSKPTKRDPSVYKVIKKDERSVTIYCPSFLWFYGFSFGPVYKYRAIWDQGQGMLVASDN